MSPCKIFKPVANYELIRLGRSNDGEYLVGKNSINNSEHLISMGLDLDWSIEEDFKKNLYHQRILLTRLISKFGGSV